MNIDAGFRSADRFTRLPAGANSTATLRARCAGLAATCAAAYALKAAVFEAGGQGVVVNPNDHLPPLDFMESLAQICGVELDTDPNNQTFLDFGPLGTGEETIMLDIGVSDTLTTGQPA